MATLPTSPINVAISEESEERRPLLSPPDEEPVRSEKDVEEKKLTKDSCKKLFIFVTLWLAYLFISAAYSVIAPFYPQEANQKGVSSFIVGFIVGCSPLCVTLFSPIFGYFLPQLGVRFLLIAGVWLVGGCFLLLAFVIDLPTSLEFIVFSSALRTVEGIGSAAYFTASFTVVSHLFPSNLGLVMGLMELGSGIGFVIGPPAGGLLYSLGGFRMPFLLTGGLTLVFAPVFFFVIPTTRAEKQSLSLKQLFKLMTNFPFVVIVIGNVIVVAALGFFTPTLSPFLINEFKLNEVQIGLVFLSAPGVYLLFSLIIGAFTDKLGGRWFMCAGLWIAGVSFFFFGPAPFISEKSILWLTIVSFSVMGLGIAFGMIPVFPEMLRVAKENDPHTDPEVLNALVSGLISSTLSFGEFLGPITGGALTEAVSFRMSAVVFGEFLLAEGLLLSGISVIDLLLKRRKPHYIQQ